MEGYVTQQLSKEGIGASEISSIAGVNPYSSAWDVWLKKTGQAEDKSSPQAEWGLRLEPAIRQAYADKTGADIYVPPASIFHSETMWARATPDGIVVKEGSGDVPRFWQSIVQCKNVGTWVEKSWREAPPEYVQLQEQWELYVTGLARADVAVLIGGSDFRIYTIHRDDALIADLVTIASEFWGLVQTKTPPKVDASDACRAHLEKRLAKREATELQADGDLDMTMSIWQDLHAEQRRIEKDVDRIRNLVRNALADARASRLVSSCGTATLTDRAGSKSTNWRLIAELLGSTKCDPAEFAALVAANTEQKPSTPTLYAPRQWAKEQTA